MKNIEKKWTILIVATFVTFFGIGYTLLKGTQATSDVPANPAFDDMNFYECVVDAYNKKNKTNLGYEVNLNEQQLQTITDLVCDNKQIKSVNGLETITSLVYLGLGFNQLTSIDVSNNTKLTNLYAPNNQLTSLDVSKNTKLVGLSLYRNQLTSMDVSNNVELSDLSLSWNQLTSLNVSNNTKLKSLGITSNQLIDLDVSKNTVLRTLNVYGNQLTELDVSKNIELTSLEVSENKLTKLDISKNTELTNLKAIRIGLTDLDVSNNTKLMSIDISGNQLAKLDISKNLELSKLYIPNNQLTELDVSYNQLTELDVSFNKLTSLDVSKNTKLTKLDVSDNQLIEFDISKNTELTNLSVIKVGLTKLDVSKHTKLTKLNVSDNQLTEFDVSKNTKLTSLSLSNNQLTELDVSKNLELTNLYIPYNQLTSLDVSTHSKLTILDVRGNLFGEILYVYKNGAVMIGNNFKTPEQLNWVAPTWTSENTSIATVNDNGIVTALEVGYVNVQGVISNKYTTTSTVNVVEITSDKYEINEDNNVIYVGNDLTEEIIKNNIKKSNEDISIELDMDNYVLYVKYVNEVLKEFKIVGYSSDIYDLSQDYIYIGTSSFNTGKINTINCESVVDGDKLLFKYGEEILAKYDIVKFSVSNYNIIGKRIKMLKDNNLYDNLLENFSGSTGVEFKILDGDIEITKGNILDGMIFKILYNGAVVDEYIVSDKYGYVNFNSSLVLDDGNYIVSNTVAGSTINDIITETNGTVTLLDKNDNILDNNSKLKTGDKIKVVFSDYELIYTISVSGDINGDGNVDNTDLKYISNHLIKDNVIIGAVYLKSADIDNNGVIDINDVIKLARLAK